MPRIDLFLGGGGPSKHLLGRSWVCGGAVDRGGDGFHEDSGTCVEGGGPSNDLLG